MKTLHTLHPASDCVLKPWGRHSATFILLGIVHSHMVIENGEQEEQQARDVGEDGELYICNHPISWA